jgi:hypothetical protein
MADLKQMEVKSICIISVFKYFGGISLIVGLILGLFGSTLNINTITPEFIRIFPFITKIGPGIPTGIAFAVIYGLIAGLGFSIFALLYNLFAGLLGGIRFFTKEG